LFGQTLGRKTGGEVTNQPSDIGRGLFGYRRSSVHRAISDRDIMLRQSENRAREAEARAAEMEERMAALQQQVTEQQLRVAEREQELADHLAALDLRMQDVNGQLGARDEEMAERERQILELRAHIDRLVRQQLEAPPRPDAPVSTMTVSEEVTVSDEVGRLLKTAEESAVRIVDQARQQAALDTADSKQQWREVQASLARFTTWRDRVEPQLEELHGRMEELRSRIAEIPDRMRAAFAPLAEASALAEAGLIGLSEDLSPPLLSAPTSSGDRTGHDLRRDTEDAAGSA
jgi:chromosome segregation ATPase